MNSLFNVLSSLMTGGNSSSRSQEEDHDLPLRMENLSIHSSKNENSLREKDSLQSKDPFDDKNSLQNQSRIQDSSKEDHNVPRAMEKQESISPQSNTSSIQNLSIHNPPTQSFTTHKSPVQSPKEIPKAIFGFDFSRSDGIVPIGPNGPLSSNEVPIDSHSVGQYTSHNAIPPNNETSNESNEEITTLDHQSNLSSPPNTTDMTSNPQAHPSPVSLSHVSPMQSFNGNWSTLDPSTIRFKMRKMRGNKSIILQDFGGPCPLIAIINTLILRGEKLDEFNPNAGSISLDGLLTIIATYVLNRTSNNNDELMQSMVAETLNLLPQLVTGLNVNVKFNGTFEFTEALTLFDLLGIRLFHCWCVDPSDPNFSIISKVSYNEALDCIVQLEIMDENQKTGNEKPADHSEHEPEHEPKSPGNHQDVSNQANETLENQVVSSEISQSNSNEISPSSNPSVPSDANNTNKDESERLIRSLVMKDFLERTQAQKTDFGVQRIYDSMKDNDVAVLFLNNHFSTIMKRRNEVFVLLTDEGYVNSSYYYSSLKNFCGEYLFYDDQFNRKV